MPLPQKSPQHSHDESLPAACSVTQGLEGAHGSEALEEPCLCSHPLMPGTSEEASDTGNPESPQSICTSSIAIATTSTSELNEGSRSEAEDSTSSRGPGTKHLPKEALDKAVSRLLRHMVLSYLKKELMTKADMKMINKEYEDHFTEIFLKASECLEVIFGLDVKEVDPVNHCYGFSIKLGLTYDGVMHGNEGIPKTGLLIVILAVIFMNGNIAPEKEVWKVLNMMGIYSGQKHYLIGEPRKLITKDFVNEKYLKYRRVANSNPSQFEFLWGSRAHAETTKMKVLEFLMKVEGTSPMSYPSQYADALRDEEERAKARFLLRALFDLMVKGRFCVRSRHFPHP
ncbi:melanoma-associated antigen B16-like isoform X2 [Suricata suricatta]|nr:melanoma-associated antigen B16-like isoform X2 [Suricata suricatta]